MKHQRREFIQLSALTMAGGLLGGLNSCQAPETQSSSPSPAGPFAIHAGDAAPITDEERRGRIEKSQRLMADQKIDALVMDAGTSMTYFTGITWWPSERPMLVVLTKKGDPKYICPGFEESRLRELITIGNDVYVWQEDESPYAAVIRALGDGGVLSGKVGLEERLRFFIFDGLRQSSPSFDWLSGDPVTVPCRMIKSANEIALMQKASDITVAAIEAGINGLQAGMHPSDVSAIISGAHRQMGADPDFALVSFAAASALPHGSRKPQELKKGDIVLMDCGCRVHGYSSDITRTMVFGAEPTDRQLTVWNLEKKAQEAGFAAAQLGAPCEAVDAAARKVITDAGFGPGYKLPGLPHRTGHGIGMDGHEWSYMVKGNRQPIEAGMCFSIEPTIAIPGEFGIRLEDCVYMTESGPHWFSHTASSIGQLFS